MAAAAHGIGYEGVAWNDDYSKWLEALLDRASLAFIASEDTKLFELRAHINTYFYSAVQDAKRLFENTKRGNDDDSEEDAESDPHESE